MEQNDRAAVARAPFDHLELSLLEVENPPARDRHLG